MDEGIIIDEELDTIDEKLVDLKGEQADKAGNLSDKLREVAFGENTYHYSEELKNCIIELSAIISTIGSFDEASFNTSPFEIKDELSASLEKIEKLYEYIAQRIKSGAIGGTLSLSKDERNMMIERYRHDLANLNFDDTESVQKELQRIKEGLIANKIHNKEFSLELAACQYRLIKEYLEKGQEEKAKDFIATFGRKAQITKTTGLIFKKSKTEEKEIAEDSKMRLYLRTFMKQLYREKVLEMDSTILDKLVKLRMQWPLNLDNLEMWKVVIAAETGKKLEQEKPQEPKNEQSIEPKKKSRDEKKKREPKEDDKDYEIITIEYDPKAEGGINKGNLKKLEKLYSQKPSKHQKPIKIVFEEGITKIPPYPQGSVSNTKCKFVSSVEFPSSLCEIGPCVFQYMDHLKSIDLSHTQVESIGSHAFFICLGLEEIKFPSTLKEIGEEAFDATENLGSIDLSHTQVERIERWTFWRSGLVEIKLPATLREIGFEAFGRTENLSSIDLSHTQVERIREKAFYCSAIKEIELPSTYHGSTDCFENAKVIIVDSDSKIQGSSPKEQQKEADLKNIEAEKRAKEEETKEEEAKGEERRKQDQERTRLVNLKNAFGRLLNDVYQSASQENREKTEYEKEVVEELKRLIENIKSVLAKESKEPQEMLDFKKKSIQISIDEKEEDVSLRQEMEECKKKMERIQHARENPNDTKVTDEQEKMIQKKENKEITLLRQRKNERKRALEDDEEQSPEVQELLEEIKRKEQEIKQNRETRAKKREAKLQKEIATIQLFEDKYKQQEERLSSFVVSKLRHRNRQYELEKRRIENDEISQELQDEVASMRKENEGMRNIIMQEMKLLRSLSNGKLIHVDQGQPNSTDDGTDFGEM